ncbi:hypothetical protein MRX96_049475, partial [Rhipicephalus microplus]
SCPDVPLGRLFPSWIKALSLSVRSLWADSRTWRYDETQVKAYYEPSQNALVIPTAIISRPFFYDESSPALNYGSLGTVWQKARQELDEFSDSENIDDFVGVKIAYRAFSSLPYRERRLTLGGLNMSAERLFFIGHCIKWCSEDQESHLVYEHQVQGDGNEKINGFRWTYLYINLLLAVGVGLFSCVLLLERISSYQSEDDTTTVDTLPYLSVPEISVSGVTRPPEEPRVRTTNASLTTPLDPHNVPTPLRPDYYCSSCACRSLAQQIRGKLDYNVDPCNDFYKFVCNSFRGRSEFENTEYLVKWLNSLSLDLRSHRTLLQFNPAEMIVRGSLEFGVPAILAISFNPKVFRDNKRIMQLEYAPDEFFRGNFKRSLNDYTKLTVLLGDHPAVAEKLAQKIKEYDDELDYFEYTTYSDQGFEPIRLNNFGSVTEPYVTSEYWSAFISLYTNNTYTSSDYIYYKEAAILILKKIYKIMGEDKLRYLIAWKFFSHLVRFTDPYLFLGDKPASEACYEHVRNVMGLAVITPFLVSGEYTLLCIVRGVHMSTVLLSSTKWAPKTLHNYTAKAMVCCMSQSGVSGRPPYIDC